MIDLRALALPLFAFACAFVTALLVTPLTILGGRRMGMMDRPGELAIHTQAVPRTGGLAMLAAFGVAVAVSGWMGTLASGDIGFPQLAGILIGLGLIALSGLLDDVRSITPVQKFLAQFFAAAVAVGAGVQVNVIPMAGVAFAFTMVYLVGGANALNLLDGMDGLAGGVTAIAALALGGLAAQQGSPTLVLLALALAGAALGYLPYNFPRVRLFMGDAGSLSLGFMLAALAAFLARHAGDVPAFAAGLTAIALPVVDTGLAILRRLGRMGDVFSGDREHIYDLLAQRRWGTAVCGPTRAVLVMYAIAITLGAMAWFIYRLPPLPALGLTTACFVALSAWAIRLGALGSQRASSAQVRQAGHVRRILSAAARRYAHVLLVDAPVVLLAFYTALILRFVDAMPAGSD